MSVATFMMFYTDWCPHCKTAKPVWDELKQERDGSVINGHVVNFVEYNCSDATVEIRSLFEKYKLKEIFPSFFLSKDDGQVIIEYTFPIENAVKYVFNGMEFFKGGQGVRYEWNGVGGWNRIEEMVTILSAPIPSKDAMEQFLESNLNKQG